MESTPEKGDGISFMKPFRELQTPEEIIAYQKRILSRTGGRTSEDARLFHYTNISALMSMVKSGYMWLSPVDKMNDILEENIISSAGIKNLHFLCFSRTSQNIAMFKMYAPSPDGIMMSISIADAKKMQNGKAYIVEETEVIDDVNTNLYWIGVCYKDLEKDKILTPAQVNTRIAKPLRALAGGIKLAGWEYEKEVRLCATKRLYPEQHLAVKLPARIDVVLGPGFDRNKYKRELSELQVNGIKYDLSVYDEWIRL